MAKYGINLSIDVKAIDKARLVAHQNGKTYLNMTAFISPDEPDQYGQHGMITQDVSKQEKDQGVKGPILGNAKVFWKDNAQQQQQGMQQAQYAVNGQQAPQVPDLEEDLPF
jgi:hypothetical protein